MIEIQVIGHPSVKRGDESSENMIKPAVGSCFFKGINIFSTRDDAKNTGVSFERITK
jgi:hypothetical protein